MGVGVVSSPSSSACCVAMSSSSSISSSSAAVSKEVDKDSPPLTGSVGDRVALTLTLTLVLYSAESSRPGARLLLLLLLLDKEPVVKISSGRSSMSNVSAVGSLCQPLVAGVADLEVNIEPIYKDIQ